MVWQAGHLLNNGKYEIIEVLGRGGFGLTYKARHRQLGVKVVIKTPDILQKRDTEYEDYVKQFEAEGRKLAKFSQDWHPHIVRISDFFMEDQVPCLVMDFIQGQTLMEKVKDQGKLSEAECLKYIRQIGSALEAVHQAGMVHRDAHPGNIMIKPNGNAILIDFGIAKEIIPASSSSTDYAANPSFAPYEQIYKGSKANRQPSVDIYALAASFYYAITGEKPTPSMERRLDDRPLKSPKEINPNLSEHINTAIVQGMALEKGDRPQLMSDWLQKLELPPQTINQEQINIEEDKKSLTFMKSSLSDEEFLQILQEGETKSWQNEEVFENLFLLEENNMAHFNEIVEVMPESPLLQEEETTSWQNEEVFGDLFLLEENNMAPFNEIAEVMPESPPPVEPQYQREEFNPPQVVTNPQVPVEIKQKKVPWDNLISLLFVYSVTGYSLWIISAPWLVEFGTIISAILFGVSYEWIVLPAIVLPLVLSWASGALVVSMMAKGSFSLIWIGFCIVIAFMTAFVVGFVTVAVVLFNFYETNEPYTNKLHKNLSRFDSFLIISITNLSGLGSGWLFAFLLHPKG